MIVWKTPLSSKVSFYFTGLMNWFKMKNYFPELVSPNFMSFLITLQLMHDYCKSHIVRGPFILVRLAVRPFSLR